MLKHLHRTPSERAGDGCAETVITGSRTTGHLLGRSGTQQSPSPRRLQSGALALAGLLGCWLVAAVVTAAPAFAHALLVNSSPAEGARLSTPPTSVTLTFSEHVTIGPGYARVLTAGGARVDTGSPAVNGDTVTIPLRGTLPAGGYVVTYRVVSADSHPVAAAYSFAVGNGPLPSAQAALPQQRTDPGVSVALPVARWVGYAGVALALGIPVLLLACWPAGWSSGRLRQLAVSGAFAVAVGALLEFLVQGPYAAGAGLGSLLAPALIGATVVSGPGAVLLIRAGLGLILGAGLSQLRRRTLRGPARLGLLALLAAGLVATFAGIGHAVAGPWPVLAFLSTAVHVAAMAVWLGGLAGMLAVVLRPDVPPGRVAEVLPRFSRLAFTAVTALVVTGIVQAVREIPTLSALFSTEYGQILLAKIVVVLFVLAAAGVSRAWLGQHLGSSRRPRRRVTAHAFAAGGPSTETARDPGPASARPQRVAEDLPALRRSVLVELGLAVVILGLTAVLVGEAPAAAVSSQPVAATLTLEGSAGPAGSVQVSVVPARPGVNSLHLYVFDQTGQPSQAAGVAVALTNRAQSVGPLSVPLLPAGPGHYLATAMTIPGAGTWTLTVTVRVDQFTATTASTTFPVR